MLRTTDSDCSSSSVGATTGCSLRAWEVEQLAEHVDEREQAGCLVDNSRSSPSCQRLWPARGVERNSTVSGPEYSTPLTSPPAEACRKGHGFNLWSVSGRSARNSHSFHIAKSSPGDEVEGRGRDGLQRRRQPRAQAQHRRGRQAAEHRLAGRERTRPPQGICCRRRLL